MQNWTSRTCPKLDELSAHLLAAAKVMSLWEVAAVLLALVYLVLVIRENILCWVAAFLSTSIYVVLMFQANLYMESPLQIFYIGMAIYGFYSWKHGLKPGEDLQVTSWPMIRNVLPVLFIFLATLISGYLLDNLTEAAMPYLDSLTTWGAIVGTWMVARKIIQNWHYWFIIDSISIYLYITRGLYLTALLCALYLVLIVVGYREWRKSLLSIQPG